MTNPPGERSPRAPRPAAVAGHVPFSGRLAMLPLVMVMFFSISGGAYGLEEVIGESGAGIGLLLLVVTPLLWLLPSVLMVAELSSAMPVEGGYYAWVKKALGPFWGFLEGWWSWLNSFVDMALYPVLFAEYFANLLERTAGVTALDDTWWIEWLVKLALIWLFTALNVIGVRRVGAVSILFGVAVLAPFALMSVIGLARLAADPVAIWQPLTPDGTSTLGAFGVGLFIVMWNYMGWDGPSTAGGEFERPARNYTVAMLWTVPLVVLGYLLPVIAGLVETPDPAAWTDGAFPDIAAAVGGNWLGTLIAAGGLVSAAGLFSALMLSNSRLPFVLAEDGYLPRPLTRLHPRLGTPWLSIILCGVIYSLFSLGAFATLVVIDVMLYAAALLLEFAALVVLRLTLPAMRRPYRVPGGWPVLALICLSPVAVLALAIAGTLRDDGYGALAVSAAALASGPLLYPLLRRYLKRDTPDVAVPVELVSVEAAGSGR